ncbi:MAG: MBL fold metallo-hydrolase [Archaeoglobaceae archaeon]|nr:MBL fold metallo-hydrolase [Archaeoglobaceae archaeon]MCX8152334.1 MBL fold metallo-hydrolase [Archaeoglobaceae archaeon]MDW8013638.1 MBL fold metallo-hydrolase [Archaeoglobaceae archaeon]
MVSSFKFENVEITYLKHASFKVKGSKVVYMDPYELPEGLEKADLILATHDHFDHFDPKSARRISKSETIVVIPKGSSVSGFLTRTVSVGEEVEVAGVKVKAVPAYNVNKPFHRKGYGVGYILTMDKVRIYHAGDTDRIPEMKGIEVDIALLPVGGKYTMDLNEAVEAAKDIKAKYYIPMHFGIPGTETDPVKFASKVKNAVVLKPLI